MSRYFTLLSLVVALSLAIVGCGGDDHSDQAAHGGDNATAVTVGNLTISDVRANMTLPTETGSFWMFITNNGSTDDALIGAEVAGCGAIELHDMVINDAGVMIMREVDGGRIPIPAGETVELKRGGLHVMCLQKAAPLAAGTTTDITLEFANAGKATISATVVTPGEMPGMMDHGSDTGGGHMGMTGESNAAHSDDAFKNGLFVNLTSDELHRAAMAISFATRTRQDMGKPVTIYLNVDGVRLAHKDAPQEPYGMAGKTIHEMLQEFIDAGGTVLLCPMCMMNVADMTADDLIPGATVSNPDLTRAALFSEGVTVLSY